MILQELVKYYETLAAQNKIAKPGWVSAKISYALNIDADGNLIGILPLKNSVQKGKKIVEEPRVMIVPEGTKRSVNIAPQYLWDNSKYLLGISAGGIVSENDNEDTIKKKEKQKQRDIECFEATKKMHATLLKNQNGNYAKAVKAFFENWDPSIAQNNNCIAEHLEDDLLSTANMIFSFAGENVFAHEDRTLKATWENRSTNSEDKQQGKCLVSGKYGPVALLHPAIKKIRGAQPAGASLVSFNASAYESFGHDKAQGLNAPVGEYATFAYTTALNNLVDSKRTCKVISDTTIVFWAEDANETYCDVFSAVLEDDNSIGQDDLEDLFTKISKGEIVDVEGVPLKPDNKFHVLGIAPNAARLSIRFYWQDSFGDLIKHLQQYYSELHIVKPTFEKWTKIPLWVLLQETANKNSRDKNASPLLAGAMIRAILNGVNYPQLLFQSIMLRVKADQDDKDKNIQKINWVKASIIKACLIRNYNIKEEITVALNEESNNIAYVLGRTFALLERIQEKANPGINATIKERYFNSACSTPSVIFPILMKLANHHLRKLRGDKSSSVYFEKMLGQLQNKINMTDKPIPSRLSLEEQGIFVLGYYHQTQKFFEKKEDK